MIHLQSMPVNRPGVSGGLRNHRSGSQYRLRMRSIPRLIHQTWRSHEIPEKWRAWSESWLRLNPEWEHRLWTDDDNRALVAEHYRWFLPIYDGYLNKISRVDAARYFILDRHGGVYADMDFECLRPLDDLLEGHELVLGCEPHAHIELALARQRGLERIVGNAFMASRPGHPFWAHVHHELVGAHRHAGPLDATGPFFLTRAVDRAPDGVTVVAPEVLYPDVSPAAAEHLGARNGDRADAYAVHHWTGSWINETPSRPSERTGVVLVIDRGQPVIDGHLRLERGPGETPLVSCLMVTRERRSFAERAIRCFQAQTYQRRELVIVDDGPDDGLADHITALADPRIRHVRLPDEGKPLGELRAISVARAQGTVVAQWDDDDLSDPERLRVQLTAITRLGTDMCLLLRERLWWPERGLLGLSVQRLWEGSMVCAKAVLPPYPALARGEDTPVVEQVYLERRTALVDMPELYTYVMHSANTFDEQHFARHFELATNILTGADYTAQVTTMTETLA